MTRTFLLAATLLAFVVTGSALAQASAIFYQTGFEQPIFTPGPIVGQGVGLSTRGAARLARYQPPSRRTGLSRCRSTQ
jgi:hypothetical protein